VPDGDARLTAALGAPEARYGLMESASLAFLVAMEALTPHQRAVLILRDVLDLSGPETAAALQSSGGGVRVALHRARKAMAAYDRHPTALDPMARRAAEALLIRFVAAVQAGDVQAVRALLTDDAVALSDGGGRYFAAGRPVRGADRIARMYVKLARLAAPDIRPSVHWVNGLPALVIRTARPHPGHAPLSVTQLQIRGDRISGVFAVLADERLTALSAPDPPAGA